MVNGLGIVRPVPRNGLMLGYAKNDSSTGTRLDLQTNSGESVIIARWGRNIYIYTCRSSISLRPVISANRLAMGLPITVEIGAARLSAENASVANFISVDATRCMGVGVFQST